MKRKRAKGGGRKAKTIAMYEAEAMAFNGCLITPNAEGSNTSRKIYILRHGPLPSKIDVCHTCDTPRCILDAHHFPGTRSENVRDSVAKGRHSCLTNPRPKGFGHWRKGVPHTDEVCKVISITSQARAKDLVQEAYRRMKMQAAWDNGARKSRYG